MPEEPSTPDQAPPSGPTRRPSLPGAGRDRLTHPGSPRRSVAFMVALVLVMIAGGTAAGVLMRRTTPATPHQLATASSSVTIPGSRHAKPVAATDAELMGLVKLQARKAPGFTLVDQHGHPVSLAALERTHEVVLTFMDDRCTDICPIVGQELADAHHDLGAAAARVAFVSVNVNAGHAAVRWLNTFIAQKAPELATMPNFDYVTGSPAALRKVWQAYHVTVQVQAGKVLHSEALYFISPGGVMRYEATPFANQRRNGTGWLPAPTITQWGQGIARYARAAL